MAIQDDLNDLLREAPMAGINMAQGMSPMKAAMSSVGAILTERVLGPAGILLGTFMGVSRAIATMIRQTDLFGRGLERMKSLQDMEQKFQAILKSATLAKERMRELASISLKSPFRIDELANASRNLELLTRGAWSSNAALTALADASIATGTDINDLAYSVGKLYSNLAKGRSVDGVAFQLQAMGAISGDLTSRLVELQNAGASFSHTWGAVTEELNRFQGAAAEEMETLNGLEKRLNAMRDAQAAAFGSNFVDQERKSLYATLKATEAFTPVLQTIGRDAAAITSVFKGWGSELRGGFWEVVKGSRILEGAYRAASLLGVGLAGATAAHLAKTTGGILSGFTKSRQAIREGARMTAKNVSTPELDSARNRRQSAKQLEEESEQAGSSVYSQIVAGELTGAAMSFLSSKGKLAQSYYQKVRARGDVASAGAKAVARRKALAAGEELTEGALSSIGNRAAFRASTTKALGDGLGFVLTKVKELALGFGSLFLAIGPIGWAVGAFTALAVGVGLVYRNIRDTRRAADEMSKAIKESTDSLREQISTIVTVEDRTAALAKAYDNLRLAQERFNKYSEGDSLKKKALEGLEAAERQVKEATNAPVAKGRYEQDIQMMGERTYYEQYERPIEDLNREAEGASPERQLEIAQKIQEIHRKNAMESKKWDATQTAFDNSALGKEYNQLITSSGNINSYATPQDELADLGKQKLKLTEEAEARTKKFQELVASGKSMSEVPQELVNHSDLAAQRMEITRKEAALKPYLSDEGRGEYEVQKRLRIEALEKRKKEIRELESDQAKAMGLPSFFGNEVEIDRLNEASKTAAPGRKQEIADQILGLKADQRARNKNLEYYRGPAGAREEDDDNARIRSRKIEAAIAQGTRSIEIATLEARKQGINEDLAAAEANVGVTKNIYNLTKEMYGIDKERTREAQRQFELAQYKANVLKAEKADREEVANRKLKSLRSQNKVSEALLKGDFKGAAKEMSEQEQRDREIELTDIRKATFDQTGSAYEADQAVERRKNEMIEENRAKVYADLISQGDAAAANTNDPYTKAGVEYLQNVRKGIQSGMSESDARASAEKTFVENGNGVLTPFDITSATSKAESAFPWLTKPVDTNNTDNRIRNLNSHVSATEMARRSKSTSVSDITRSIDEAKVLHNILKAVETENTIK